MLGLGWNAQRDIFIKWMQYSLILNRWSWNATQNSWFTLPLPQHCRRTNRSQENQGSLVSKWVLLSKLPKNGSQNNKYFMQVGQYTVQPCFNYIIILTERLESNWLLNPTLPSNQFSPALAPALAMSLALLKCRWQKNAQLKEQRSKKNANNKKTLSSSFSPITQSQSDLPRTS